MGLFGKSKQEKARQTLTALKVEVPTVAAAYSNSLCKSLNITDVDTQWKVRTEILSLLCHIVSRWSLETGGATFRAYVQDEVTLYAVQVTVESSWAPPATTGSKLDFREWQGRMKQELLDNINVADTEYAACRALIGESVSGLYSKDNILGRFIANIVQLHEDDPEIRLGVGLTASQMIAESGIRQQIEYIWQNVK